MHLVFRINTIFVPTSFVGFKYKILNMTVWEVRWGGVGDGVYDVFLIIPLELITFKSSLLQLLSEAK